MIGALRTQIDILEETRVADAGGGASVSWNVGASVWARVEALSAVRGGVGDRTPPLRRVAAVIRPREGVTLGGRFRFDGADFDIVSIESDDARPPRVTLIGEEAAS